jgi:hypothetical protein
MNESIRATLADLLRQASSGSFQLLPPHVPDLPPDAPEALRQAIAEFDALPEWLSVVAHLCLVPTPAGPVWLYLIGFELSRDGFFVAVGADGQDHGAGQYISGQVAWGTRPQVIACLSNGQRLPELQPAKGWQEQANGTYVSACGQFTIRKEKKGWHLRRGKASIQVWDTLENAQAHGEAMALPPE